MLFEEGQKLAGGIIESTGAFAQLGDNFFFVTIAGNNFTLSGNDQFRGLFVGAWTPGTATQVSVTVTIQDLTIQNAKAAGGAGEFPALRVGQAQDFGNHGHDDAVGAALEQPIDFAIERFVVDRFVVMVGRLKDAQHARQLPRWLFRTGHDNPTRR